MAFSKDNQPARVPQGSNETPAPKRRSKLLGNINARAVGEAVLVSALLSVVAFWQGDLVSSKLDMFLDDGRAWPVDGVVAILLGGFLALTKKVKPINKIRFVPGLMVYGFNSIYAAREAAGLMTP